MHSKYRKSCTINKNVHDCVCDLNVRVCVCNRVVSYSLSYQFNTATSLPKFIYSSYISENLKINRLKPIFFLLSLFSFNHFYIHVTFACASSAYVLRRVWGLQKRTRENTPGRGKMRERERNTSERVKFFFFLCGPSYQTNRRLVLSSLLFSFSLGRIIESR